MTGVPVLDALEDNNSPGIDERTQRRAAHRALQYLFEAGKRDDRRKSTLNPGMKVSDGVIVMSGPMVQN